MPSGRRNKPQHENLVLVGWPIRGSGKLPYFSFDLTTKEFASIGFVVVQWSYLEYALSVRTRAIAKRTKCPVPADATAVSFSRRLRAFAKLVDQRLKRKQTKAFYQALVSRIAKAAGDRHGIAHDLWTYNPRNPSQLWITRATRRDARSKPLDMKRIGQFGESIGVLSYALMNPPSYGGGMPEIPSGFFSYMSRSMRLAIQDDGPADGH
jgi:hypothetical protein